MKCPYCDVPMKAINRRGVEIDVCPECKGVWLDRGELDKLLATSEQMMHEYETRPREEPPYRKHDDDPRDYHHHHKRKKSSWLSEIFDFD